MKEYKTHNVGERIEILIANKKNPQRKDDVGRQGIVNEVRCSFVKVLLDGDQKDKNYNYGTFKVVQPVVE